MNGREAGRGFTLIEMMVTLALITIIISLGVPMYGQFTQSSHLTSRTSELVSAINLARSEAVTRRVDVRLAAIGGDWTQGWEVLDNAATVPLLRRDDYRNADVGYDVDGFDAAWAPITEFEFDAQGRSSEAASFTVCLRGAANRAKSPANAGRLLTLSRFGRVQTVDINIVDAPVNRSCP